MIIREARPGDHAAIRDVLAAAFNGAAEADLVEQLRTAGYAEIELVAEEGGEIVGHILFSPMEAPFRALGLAPLSVLPHAQRQGIGSTLVERSHEMARADGWDAIFVLGDPDYYRRFGYSPEAAKPFDCAYSGPHFMMKEFGRSAPVSSGKLRHAPPFEALG